MSPRAVGDDVQFATKQNVQAAVKLLQDCLTEYFVKHEGYSVKRAKTTRVYAALLKLGGSWNG